MCRPTLSHVLRRHAASQNRANPNYSSKHDKADNTPMVSVHYAVLLSVRRTSYYVASTCRLIPTKQRPRQYS